MVTYGAMSQQPLTVPPGLLIFNDIRLRGFWLTGGYSKASVGAALGGAVGACRPGDSGSLPLLTWCILYSPASRNNR